MDGAGQWPNERDGSHGWERRLHDQRPHRGYLHGVRHGPNGLVADLARHGLRSSDLLERNGWFLARSARDRGRYRLQWRRFRLREHVIINAQQVMNGPGGISPGPFVVLWATAPGHLTAFRLQQSLMEPDGRHLEVYRAICAIGLSLE